MSAAATLEEEEDVCRVCRTGSEKDHPLFHPCKCSGSIRFVHQDCLMTWLKASNRKYCELCNATYSWTKVYDPRMPHHLPFLVLITRLAKQSVVGLAFVSRAVLVGTTWLALVPWLAIWACRVYFFFGNGLAWSLSGNAGSSNRPVSFRTGSSIHDETVPLVNSTLAPTFNDTDLSEPSTSIPHPPYPSRFSYFPTSPQLSTLLKDIFQGQILTAAIVLSFLAIFLMREWVMQNQPAAPVPGRPAAQQQDGAAQVEEGGAGGHVGHARRPDGREIARLPAGAGRPPPVVPRPRDMYMDEAGNLIPMGPALRGRVWEEEMKLLEAAKAARGEGGIKGQGRPAEVDAGDRGLDGHGSVEAIREAGVGKEREREEDWEDAEDDNEEVEDTARPPPDLDAMRLARQLRFNNDTYNDGSNGDNTTLSSSLPSEPITRPILSSSSVSSPSSQLHELPSSPASPSLPQLKRFGFVSPRKDFIPLPPSASPSPTTASIALPDPDIPFQPNPDTLFASTSASSAHARIVDASTDISLTPSSASKSSPSPSNIEALRSQFLSETGPRQAPITLPNGEVRYIRLPEDPTVLIDFSPIMHEMTARNIPKTPEFSDVLQTIFHGEGYRQHILTAEHPLSKEEYIADRERVVDARLAAAKTRGEIVRRLQAEDQLKQARDKGDMEGMQALLKKTKLKRNDAVEDVQSLLDRTKRDRRRGIAPLPGTENMGSSRGTEGRRRLRPIGSPGLAPPEYEVTRPAKLSWDDDDHQEDNEAGPSTSIQGAPYPADARPSLTSLDASGNFIDTPIPTPRSQTVLAVDLPPITDLASSSASVRPPTPPRPPRTPSPSQSDLEGAAEFERIRLGDITQNPFAALVNAEAEAGGSGAEEGEGEGEEEEEMPALEEVDEEDREDEEEDEEAQAAEEAQLVQIQAEEAEDRLNDEDLEGILEAVGMRGPVWMLPQNAALVTLFITLLIASTIWLPFCLGKTLLLLNFIDVYRIVRYPVHLVRFVTDPAVELVLRLVLPPLDAVLLPILSLIRSPKTTGSTNIEDVAPISPSFLAQAKDSIVALASSLVSSPIITPTETRNLPAKILPYLPTFLSRPIHTPTSQILDTLASIGSTSHRFHIFLGLLRAGEIPNLGFSSLAQGDSAWDRFFAVSVGYVVVSGALAIWLMRGSDDKGGWAGSLREILKQNSMVAKLSFFMAIELVIFPLGCGVLLSISSLPLAASEAVWSRLAFTVGNPIISTLLHWLAGTMFMFGFASILTYGRSKLRKGTFYFVRDPADPSFHPVTEIVEKPTGEQLKKLAISAGMYTFLIFASFGSILGLLRLVSPVFPLRWDYGKPISQIPVDLLFLYFVPTVVVRLRPDRKLKRFVLTWWTDSIHVLRLSSYFLGPTLAAPYLDLNRKIPIADTPGRTHLDLLVNFIALQDVMKGKAGFVRVPASDTLTIVPKARVFVRLDGKMMPVDEEERKLMLEQNRKAEEAGRSAAKDYGVVWLPVHVRTRVYLLLVSMWASLVVLFTSCFVVPLALGRHVLQSFLGYEIFIHDGYALMIGVVLGFTLYTIGKSGYRKIKRFHQADRLRKTALYGRIKRNIILVLKLAYLLPIACFLIPLSLALLVELYVLMPFRQANEEPVVFFVWESWAMGVLWMNALYLARGYLPDDLHIKRNISRVYTEFQRHGFQPNIAIAQITRDIFVPILASAFLLAAAPALFIVLANLIFPDTSFRYTYEAFLAWAVGWKSAPFLARKLFKFMDNLREREYLVEIRLRNVEPDGTVEGVEREEGLRSGKGLNPDRAAPVVL